MRVLHLTTGFPPVIFGGLGTAVGGRVLTAAELTEVRDRVLFTGWLTPAQTSARYVRADVLVILRYQPFGMVVLEGMLEGMAIAASTSAMQDLYAQAVSVGSGLGEAA